MWSLLCYKYQRKNKFSEICMMRTGYKRESHGNFLNLPNMTLTLQKGYFNKKNIKITPFTFLASVLKELRMEWEWNL